MKLNADSMRGLTAASNKIERMTAKEMTSYVRARFGPEFYALKQFRRREIIKLIPGPGTPSLPDAGVVYADVYASAETWVDALHQANVKVAEEEKATVRR